MTKNDAPAQKPGLWKRMCRSISPDWMFALLLGVVVYTVAKGMFGFGDDPESGMGVLAGAIVLTGIISAIGSRMDKRMLEDFHFRLMCQGAVVGVVSTLIIVTMYDILDDRLPALSAHQVLITLLGTWSIGYFYHRWRGLDV